MITLEPPSDSVWVSEKGKETLHLVDRSCIWRESCKSLPYPMLDKVTQYFLTKNNHTQP